MSTCLSASSIFSFITITYFNHKTHTEKDEKKKKMKLMEGQKILIMIE